MGNADTGSLPFSEENSPDAARAIALRLEELRERLGLDGTHHSWLDDPVRRAKAREERLTINNETPYINKAFNDLLTGPLSNEAELDASRNHPDTLDRIGVPQTVALLVGTFNIFAGAEFARWSKQQKPYEVFVASLEPIRLSAIKDCGAVWSGRVAADPTWLDRMILPKAAEQLESAKDAWSDKARATELAHLESKYESTEEEKHRGAEIDRLVQQAREEQIQRDRDDDRRREEELRHAEALAKIQIETTRKTLALEREAAVPKPAPEAEPLMPAKGEPHSLTLAEWLQNELNLRNWTKHDLWKNHGPHHKTVQTILDGDPASPIIRKRIADGLSLGWVNNKRAIVTLGQIPRD